MQFINSAPFSRAVILVPVIGYWLIFNDHLLKQFGDLWAELVPPAEPPKKPWRLLWTYFGLCMVGAGSAIYHVFCPPEIKRYPGNTDYVAAIAPHISDIEVERVNVALEKGDASSRSMLRNFMEQAEVPLKMRPEERRERARRDQLTAHFDLLNRSWFPARVAAFTLYVAGVITLLVPAWDIFLRVARSVLAG